MGSGAFPYRALMSPMAVIWSVVSPRISKASSNSRWKLPSGRKRRKPSVVFALGVKAREADRPYLRQICGRAFLRAFQDGCRRVCSSGGCVPSRTPVNFARGPCISRGNVEGARHPHISAA